jgi:serine/threonine protein kinase
LNGQTLRARIAAGPLPGRVALGFALEMANGLIAAHHLGVVHRDLKPENVFVTDGGRLKILDFGLAKCKSDKAGFPDDSSKSTQPGIILGTVGYMSPEQVRGGTIDERTDIFSVGVMLYEMLAGRAPFERETPVETLYAILKEEPSALGGQRDIVEEIEHVVRHCLEKSPNARFQSARDLAFVLDFTLRTMPDAPPPPRRQNRWGMFDALMSLM